MRKKTQAFTLIELAIAVFILLLILMLSVPSISGVLADRRLRRSFDQMNNLVRTAQERSVNDRRTYLITWEKDQIVLHAEAFAEGENKSPLAFLKVQRGDVFTLDLTAALTEKPAPEWIFWPSGVCEPATVSFKGDDGTWTANYSALTARAELAKYATR
ncbi:MAG: prepilin-type N-terminal cleavage/methylation domain-containing protein [Verrucomicrobiota bacterium]|nr:prepilin-type N-terminal cleavage/methylation domain-containing protein [Verrucomicrobiota bacterium]MDQ6939304.1 prepilin-type N-terminal cleavage/methylation domain-containing protein [Verrucomicrobiota bacterium]